MSIWRSSLKTWRDKEGAGSGIFRVLIQGGRPPYKLKLKKAPISYKWPAGWDGTIDLGAVKDRLLYHFTDGEYTFQVSDECMTAPEMKVQMKNGQLVGEILGYPTPSRREGMCQWLELVTRYYNESGAGMEPYHEERTGVNNRVDTLNQYFDVGILFQKDKDNLTRTLPELSADALYFSGEYTMSVKDGKYGHIHFHVKLPPEVHPFQINSLEHPYVPYIICQEEGHPETRVKRGPRINYLSGHDGHDHVDRKRVRSTPCAPSYRLDIHLNSGTHVPICLPLKATLVELNGATPVAGTEKTLTITDDMVYSFPGLLSDAKRYQLTTLTAQGDQRIKILEAPTPGIVALAVGIPQYCTGTTKAMGYVYLYKSEKYMNFNGFTFLLKAAPVGYTPPAIGAPEIGNPIKLPDDFNKGQIHFMSPDNPDYYILPSGTYLFELTDPCGVKYEKSFTVKETPLYKKGKKELTPKVVVRDCGKVKVRIYPFPTGNDDLVLMDGALTTHFLLRVTRPREIPILAISVYYGGEKKSWEPNTSMPMAPPRATSPKIFT